MSLFVLTTALQVVEIQTDNSRVGLAALVLSVADQRPFLANKLVAYAVDWGDGSTVYASGSLASPVGPSNLDHIYQPGNYVLTVTAHNFAVPSQDEDRAVFDVTVRGNALPTLTIQPVVFGPVLPRDNGFPSPLEWEFNVGQDNAMLVSSAKLLLSTAVGERLMRPDYGTNLAALLFDPNDAATDDSIQQELARALAVHEPRLSVASASFSRVGTTAIAANFVLRSKLDNRTIPLTATFVSPA